MSEKTSPLVKNEKKRGGAFFTKGEERMSYQKDHPGNRNGNREKKKKVSSKTLQARGKKKEVNVHGRKRGQVPVLPPFLTRPKQGRERREKTRGAHCGKREKKKKGTPHFVMRGGGIRREKRKHDDPARKRRTRRRKESRLGGKGKSKVGESLTLSLNPKGVWTILRGGAIKKGKGEESPFFAGKKNAPGISTA